MNPSERVEREVAALGLEVAALVGMHVDEVRRRIDSPDLTLILADGDVPDAWPPEILDRSTYDKDEPRHCASFQTQLEDGTWIGHYAWGRPLPVAEWERMPAYIYTRSPRATPEAVIRPIVSLMFDADRICIEADAEVVEFVFRNRLHANRGEEEGEDVLDVRVSGGSVEATRLHEDLGLAGPTRIVDVRGAACAGRCGWVPSCEADLLLFLDADFQQRMIIIDSDEGHQLGVQDGDADMFPMTLTSAGTRVTLFDDEGCSRVHFDVYGGGLPLTVTDGDHEFHCGVAVVARRAEDAQPDGSGGRVILLAERGSDHTPAVRTLTLDRAAETVRIGPAVHTVHVAEHGERLGLFIEVGS